MMCYYCGQHLRIKEAALVCYNVLCKLFGEPQLQTKDIPVKSDIS
jgi:hypothetical protein